LALQEDMDKASEFSANFEKEELLKQLQAQYEDNHKIKVGIEKVLQMDTTAPEVKKILEQEKEKTISTVQQKVENKAQEVDRKLQQVIETKKQEQEQKLLDAQNALKSKLQEKIKDKLVPINQ
jgi:hypothetical protein